MTILRIGTRGSPLALAQANEVRTRLLAAHPQFSPSQIELIPIKTTGDIRLDQNLADIGGKGLFIKEIEEALLAGSIDIAVHSMKDMPPHIPEKLMVPCLLPREDTRDAFISIDYKTMEDLPYGAVIGTSSLRRQAQILALRPDCVIIPFRGNVQTRLDKLAQGLAHATLLAVAGLKRLNKLECASTILPADLMLPAVAQGAIGVECRQKDTATQELLAPLHHKETGICVTAERAVLTVLDGNCRTPIAAYATLQGDTLLLSALVASPDGKHILRHQAEGMPEYAWEIGTMVGKALKEKGGV